MFIAIGANLSGQDGRTARATCILGAEALRSLPYLEFKQMSRWYATQSIPAGGPDYVNGVALLEGDVDPAWLLARLQRIEARAGRVRSVPDAPRVLDLDIVAMGGLIRAAPHPVLPHPRAHLRRFVMQPLAELAPHWLHPISGLPVSQLLQRVSDQWATAL